MMDPALADAERFNIEDEEADMMTRFDCLTLGESSRFDEVPADDRPRFDEVLVDDGTQFDEVPAYESSHFDEVPADDGSLFDNVPVDDGSQFDGVCVDDGSQFDEVLADDWSQFDSVVADDGVGQRSHVRVPHSAVEGAPLLFGALGGIERIERDSLARLLDLGPECASRAASLCVSASDSLDNEMDHLRTALVRSLPGEGEVVDRLMRWAAETHGARQLWYSLPNAHITKSEGRWFALLRGVDEVEAARAHFPNEDLTVEGEVSLLHLGNCARAAEFRRWCCAERGTPPVSEFCPITQGP